MGVEEKLVLFVGFLILFLTLQKVFPLDKRYQETRIRFSQNFTHVFLAQAIMFLFFYLIGKTFFEISESLKIGLFHFVNLNFFSFELDVQFILTFIILDLALYWQHRASHKWSWFWRIHRVHHSDSMLTASTAVRFHFLEIFVSALWKGLLIVALGLSFRDFILFEVFLSSCALFNHSNLKINRGLNKFLGGHVVTPELHRIHHSTDLSLSSSNFGFSVIYWDKIFKSFSLNRKIESVGVEGLKGDRLTEQILLRGGESET